MHKFCISVRSFVCAILTTGLITACSTPLAYERPSEVTVEEPDWAAVEEALAEYEFTPFTLALIGEVERPPEGVKLDETSPTDIAYCRNFSQRGMQSRIGSDFWKRSVEYDLKLQFRLAELVSEPEHVEWLTWQAEGIYMDAIEFARSGDAAAAMNFNFGGHAKVCAAFAETLPAVG